jgi:hypothetical protein
MAFLAPLGARRTRDLKWVTVDTTVQPEAITFPTNRRRIAASSRRRARTTARQFADARRK